MQRVITPDEAVTHELGGIRFASYASPARTGGDLAFWRVELPAGEPATPHVITRQEIHAVLAGEITVTTDDAEFVARPGDVVVASPGETVRLANAGTVPATAWVTTTRGFTARMPDGSTLAPPWAG